MINFMILYRRLISFPGKTKIFCGHEYTLSNLEFVKSQISNEIIERKYLETLDKRAKNQITLPSTLETERKINPFLLETVPDDIRDLDEADCFKELRIRKDNFKKKGCEAALKYIQINY